MQELPKFCERLSELMFYADNITADKLGKVLNLGGSTIRQWRAGKRSPTFFNALRLAEYFGCSLDYLAGRIDDDIKFTPQPILPFHERLLYILNERGLTWYKVVKDTKISISNIHDWRSGSSPLLPRLIELADYLDVTLDYLVGRDR